MRNILPTPETQDSHSQIQTTCLEATPAGAGLKINRKKTELMKINTTANTPFTVGGEPIREVESFVYLGSVVEKIRNEERWELAGQEPVAKQILRRKWGSGSQHLAPHAKP
nr:hypothetical protein BaRGS_011872 [Batillaria attramentaria]